jgi:hypothetical protein
MYVRFVPCRVQLMSRLGDGEIEEVARGSGYPSGQLVGHSVCVELKGRSSDTGISERFDRSCVRL